MGDIQGSDQYVDYGQVADRYQVGRQLPPEVLDRWRAAVLPHLPAPPVRVLDLGAGTGIFAAAWPEWLPAQVVAVEPNEAMIRAGPAGVRYVRAAAEALPLASRSVDVVWVSTSLHHFSDLRVAVAELTRVLRDSGRVLVRTFLPGRSGTSWLDAFPGRDKALRRFMSLAELAEVFAAAGLVVEHAAEVLEETRTFGESADWVERMRHADSMLTALTDAEIAVGVAALRAAPDRPARNELSLVVFSRA